MEVATHVMVYLVGVLTGMYAAHKMEEKENKNK